MKNEEEMIALGLIERWDGIRDAKQVGYWDGLDNSEESKAQCKSHKIDEYMAGWNEARELRVGQEKAREYRKKLKQRKAEG